MKSIFLLFTITLFFSCNLINPDEKEPAYLHIASYTLSASSTQGGNTHKVTDAWVYVNGNSLGAYQMPVTLPVLETGEVVLEIFPGIKTNGIAELPEIYPFYKRDSIAIELKAGKKTTIQPVTSYTDDTKFVLVEQFSENNHALDFDADQKEETEMIQITDSRSLDGGSGYVHIDTMNNFFDIGSIVLEDYPTLSRTFYLEMDYKTDVVINVGLVAYANDGSVIFSDFNQGVLPNAEWNKIYLDLSDAMTGLKAQPGFSYYRLHFTGFFPLDNDEGRTEADFFVDNVKLLMF